MKGHAEKTESSSKQAFWLAVLALGIGLFLLTSTLRNIRSWQGKASPPADEDEEEPTPAIEIVQPTEDPVQFGTHYAEK